MDNESIRKAMLKCCKDCRVNVVPFGNIASLVWSSKAGLYKELIAKNKLSIDNVEFKTLLERAKEALIN